MIGPVVNSPPVAIVTGGSAGLGLAISSAFVQSGYVVVILSRDSQRLNQACEQLSPLAINSAKIIGIQVDLTEPDQVVAAFDQIKHQLGRLDVLVNNVGMSDRGTIESLEPHHMMSIIKTNLVPTLLCSRAALDLLKESRGSIINIGSLAAKVGARYLGAYPAAKHALAGLTQQMRLEWKAYGVHVGLINPGPIRRDDAGNRYSDRVSQDPSLPEQSKQPGGGTRVKGLPADQVAALVLRMIKGRQIDRMLPSYLRPLVAIGNLYPPLGDWLLLKFTSSKK